MVRPPGPISSDGSVGIISEQPVCLGGGETVERSGRRDPELAESMPPGVLEAHRGRGR